MRKNRFLNNYLGWFFLLPVLLIIIGFLVVPIFESIRNSFFTWDGFSPVKKFVGIGNYIEVFTNSDEFLVALKNTFIFQFGITAGQVTTGLILALIIDSRVRFWRAYRVIFFLPYVLSAFVVVLIWGKVFQHNGLLNDILASLNLENLQRYWLLKTTTSIPAMIFIRIWQFASFPMLFFMAGLQNIDEQIYEAAKIDGATTIQRITRISIPMIKNLIMLMVTMNMIYNFNTFVLVFIMTRGGPSGATEVLGTLIYKFAFGIQRVGYSSVLSVICIIFALVMGLAYYKISGYGKK